MSREIGGFGVALSQRERPERASVLVFDANMAQMCSSWTTVSVKIDPERSTRNSNLRKEGERIDDTGIGWRQQRR